MMQLSLVNADRLKKDPTKLLYLYPSMPKIRYAKQVDIYYREQAIAAAEKVARAQNALLVPVRCIHYKRRDQSKRVVLFGRSYYIMQLDDMTDLEIEKYKLVCAKDKEYESDDIAL